MGSLASVAKFVIEGVLTSILGAFGVAGNIVSIKVLSNRDLDMTPTFRHLLKMLAAFDATFLIFTLSLFCVSSWSEVYETYVKPWLTPYLLPIIQISLTGSVWTTMAVSVERYLTVCMGYRPQKVQHLFYTLPIVSLSLLFNIPRFFELHTVMKEKNVTMVDMTGEPVNVTIHLPSADATDLRKNPGYSRDYVLLVNSFALAFIPMIVLIVLNSLIYRTIARATRLHNAISSNQRRDHKVAMMLIAIVAVFVVCHSMRSFINGYECYQMARYGELKYWPKWVQFLVDVNHCALVVNSSINILIYACKDEKFLRVLLVTIKLRPPRSGLRPSDSRSPDLVEMTATVATGPLLHNTGGASANAIKSSSQPTSPKLRDRGLGRGSRDPQCGRRGGGDGGGDGGGGRRKLMETIRLGAWKKVAGKRCNKDFGEERRLAPNPTSLPDMRVLSTATIMATANAANGNSKCVATSEPYDASRKLVGADV